jgi:hypothetical protein
MNRDAQTRIDLTENRPLSVIPSHEARLAMRVRRIVSIVTSAFNTSMYGITNIEVSVYKRPRPRLHINAFVRRLGNRSFG